MSDAQHVISIDAAGFVFVDDVGMGTSLTRTQETYLRAIFSSKGVATREFIVATVYGGRDEPESNIVDTIVCHVRRRLGIHRRAIQTAWGRGFSIHPAYVLSPADRTVGVNVDSDLIEELSRITSEQPDALVTRLLKAEHERLWA